MNKIFNTLKKFYTSILLWFKFRKTKIGNIQIEVPDSNIVQPVKVEQQTLDVNLDDWKDLIHNVFETNNFVAGRHFPTEQTLG